MNKKAVSENALLWIIRIISTLAAIAILVMLVNGSIEESLKLGDLRFYPIAERALYSKNCFIVVKERPYPGIIDADRFTQDSIEECMYPLDKAIGARFTLTYDGNSEVLYFNQERFEELLDLTFAEQFVLGKKMYYVLVQDEALLPGNLLVEVAWQQ